MNTPHLPAHVIARVTSEAEAVAICAALAGEGIEVVKSSGAAADFRVGIAGNYELLVHDADADRARALIERLRQESKQIDWSQVDVGDPEQESN